MGLRERGAGGMDGRPREGWVGLGEIECKRESKKGREFADTWNGTQCLGAA